MGSTISDACDDTYFMYELRLESGESLPSFMKFDEFSRVLTVQTDSLSDEDNYTIVVYAVLINGQYSEGSFNV